MAEVKYLIFAEFRRSIPRGHRKQSVQFVPDRGTGLEEFAAVGYLVL
jgi:hypothetical protein